jgi:hypothetical protein
LAATFPHVRVDHHIELGYNMTSLTAWLQISRATAHRRVRERQIYALVGSQGGFLYPSFQFDEHGAEGPELFEIIDALGNVYRSLGYRSAACGRTRRTCSHQPLEFRRHRRSNRQRPRPRQRQKTLSPEERTTMTSEFTPPVRGSCALRETLVCGAAVTEPRAIRALLNFFSARPLPRHTPEGRAWFTGIAGTGTETIRICPNSGPLLDRPPAGPFQRAQYRAHPDFFCNSQFQPSFLRRRPGFAFVLQLAHFSDQNVRRRNICERHHRDTTKEFVNVISRGAGGIGVIGDRPLLSCDRVSDPDCIFVLKERRPDPDPFRLDGCCDPHQPRPSTEQFGWRGKVSRFQAAPAAPHHKTTVPDVKISESPAPDWEILMTRMRSAHAQREQNT